MKQLSLLAIIVLFVSCSKQKDSQSSARNLLTAHKWYYHVFTQDGLNIPLNYCDTNNYLIFSDGGNGGLGNDHDQCYGKSGTISTFTYTFSPDSNVIHLKNFLGSNYTWNIITLNNRTLEVAFTVSAPPPAFAPNYNFVYTIR